MEKPIKQEITNNKMPSSNGGKGGIITMTIEEFNKIRSRLCMSILRNKPLETKDEKTAMIYAYMRETEKLRQMKQNILNNY